MSSEVDKLLSMAKDLNNDLSRIQSKLISLQSNRNEMEEKIIKLANMCEILESEIQKRDAYIRQLEKAVIDLKRNSRYW